MPVRRNKEVSRGLGVCMSPMVKPITVAGAGGFWGDQVMAPVTLLQNADVDYITMDYLAEVTMSIMHKQRNRDPTAGWATDLFEWLEEGGLELLQVRGTKLVTNAGGANPNSCAEAILGLACALGWSDCQIAIVVGDDIHPKMTKFCASEQISDLDGNNVADCVAEDLISANAYLGAGPIARALERGADIVLTGRVADASLIVASMLHAEGWAKRAEVHEMPLCSPIEEWAPNDVARPLDVIAGWTLAGHLIECGAQVTGGNADGWAEIEDFVNLGYPIAEIESDGTCVITKPELSGGAVTRANVAEQMIYEIGDPSGYKTPDIVLDLRKVELHDVGKNRVRAIGAVGKRRPDKLKVSSCYSDGWFATGSLLIPGPKAIAKANVTDNILRGRLAGLKGLTIHTELMGTGVTMPKGSVEVSRLKSSRNGEHDLPEVLIRWSAKSQNRSDIELFSKAIAPLVLTGPGGVSGYSARPKPRSQLRFLPLLVKRNEVEVAVQIPMLRTLRTALTERRPDLEARVFNRLQRIAERERKGLTKRIASRVIKGLEKPVEKARGGK